MNTGCVTLWKLTDEFCKKIPDNKSNKVIFTLTDYQKNSERDKILINELTKNYKEIYFWIQGAHDLEYLKSLTDVSEINIIPSNLSSYDELLNDNEIDYVGTRLHAGIFALRHARRTIIVSIDERIKSMNKYVPTVFIQAEDIKCLNKKINSDFNVKTNLNWDAINEWKGQFN